jgi:pyruvate dehydrogenase E2 component (dihydrolipoamide acetyltransferase)
MVNLILYGIKSCAPIFRLPQSCSLAIGTNENRIIVSDDTTKEYEQAPYVTVTMACDHRVVDGTTGAQWLSTLKQLLENPVTLLL